MSSITNAVIGAVIGAAGSYAGNYLRTETSLSSIATRYGPYNSGLYASAAAGAYMYYTYTFFGVGPMWAEALAVGALCGLMLN